MQIESVTAETGSRTSLRITKHVSVALGWSGR